jgi:hypothetical protein
MNVEFVFIIFVLGFFRFASLLKTGVSNALFEPNAGAFTPEALEGCWEFTSLLFSFVSVDDLDSSCSLMLYVEKFGIEELRLYSFGGLFLSLVMTIESLTPVVGGYIVVVKGFVLIG